MARALLFVLATARALAPEALGTLFKGLAPKGASAGQKLADALLAAATRRGEALRGGGRHASCQQLLSHCHLPLHLESAPVLGEETPELRIPGVDMEKLEAAEASSPDRFPDE